jgi:hypothetical protein
MRTNKYSMPPIVILVIIFTYKNQKIIECYANHTVYYSTPSRLVWVSVVAVNRANAHFDSPTLRGQCYPSHHVLVSLFIVTVNRGDVHFDSLTACLCVLGRGKLRRCWLLSPVTLSGNHFFETHNSSWTRQTKVVIDALGITCSSPCPSSQ